MKKMAISAAAAALAVLCASGAGAEEALPPAVGQPLQKARALLQSHHYPQALQQVAIAASKATTDNERFIIAEMRASIYQASGDTAHAASEFQNLIYSGKISGAEKQKLIQAEVSIAFQQRNYQTALAWLVKYFAAGGNSPEMVDLRISAYYQSGDYANAAKLQLAQIAAEQKAHQIPKETQLQLLASCQDKAQDRAGFENTMIQLVFYYPKPDYWANLVHNVEVSPGFSDRLTLDLDRVKYALGTITDGKDYMEMTELALQGPLPGEAKAIIDKGYAAGALGTGPEADRAKRLRALVYKTYDSELKDLPKREADASSAHDGNPSVALGEEYASYGNYAKGISLIEQGIAKDELRHPEDTKLHLAIAYMNSGNKAKALQIFRTVGGKDGAAGIARLWILWLNAKKTG